MSRDSFRNYDAWLKALFQRAQEGEHLVEAWEQYCDDEGVDPEDTEAYEEWLSNLYSRDNEPDEPRIEEREE